MPATLRASPEIIFEQFETKLDLDQPSEAKKSKCFAMPRFMGMWRKKSIGA
eukprot:CAMPEP_0196740978 /NCGR_PEP_ID=MMETSP1091-20130531/36863_1 /TAXON_ID=302021 /ORGANISM="Rhodomonas sp., Strain CCMP768" /LENGTH=50 /DNA_ID=CAMNT_0042086425 /DNA_START=57 /DNA_END=209 /DNA_ORIENTATION=+